MAVTFTVTKKKVYVVGDRKEVVADIACTGTPTVGGDALTAAALDLDELNMVDPCGGASVAGGTSGLSLAVVHEPGGDTSKVLVVFYVQGTAGPGNSMVAYTGATASMAFRVRAVGKGKAAA